MQVHVDLAAHVYKSTRPSSLSKKSACRRLTYKILFEAPPQTPPGLPAPDPGWGSAPDPAGALPQAAPLPGRTPLSGLKASSDLVGPTHVLACYPTPTPGGVKSKHHAKQPHAAERNTRIVRESAVPTAAPPQCTIAQRLAHPSKPTVLTSYISRCSSPAHAENTLQNPLLRCGPCMLSSIP